MHVDVLDDVLPTHNDCSKTMMIQQLQEVIHKKTGLDVRRSDQSSLFQQVFEQEKKRRTLSSSKLIQYLFQNSRAFSSFVEALSVGGTYFFRHRSQWSALKKIHPPKMNGENKLGEIRLLGKVYAYLDMGAILQDARLMVE